MPEIDCVNRGDFGGKRCTFGVKRCSFGENRGILGENQGDSGTSHDHSDRNQPHREELSPEVASRILEVLAEEEDKKEAALTAKKNVQEKQEVDGL